MTAVVANLSFIVPGAVGGSEEYSVRLLEAVAEKGADDLEVRVAGHRSLFLNHPSIADPQSRYSFRGPIHRRPYRVAVESTWLNRVTREAALVHHFGGRLPARGRRPAVVTIHDIQPLDLPENFSGVKQRYLRWVLPRTAAAAALICTPSQWVADRVVERLGVPHDRVRVVSSTAGSNRTPGDPSPLVSELGARPLILYPAVTHPHKNHSVLISAMPGVLRRHPEALLVLTGGRGGAHEQVVESIRSSGLEGSSIRHLGRIDHATLVELTGRADVVAFPSQYEGFGLPVLEAMQRGTPVVAGNATALPEVVGDAGVLVDPEDPERWAAEIADLLGDDRRRTELAVAGAARAAEYEPDGAAASLLAAWRDALA